VHLKVWDDKLRCSNIMFLVNLNRRPLMLKAIHLGCEYFLIYLLKIIFLPFYVIIMFFASLAI